MRQIMIRYAAQPHRADENERLIKAVYDELEGSRPAGLRYAAFRLDDGVGFVHLASVETPDGRNPLSDVAAFARFQEHIGDRCDGDPVVSVLHRIGAYRMLGDGSGR
jgi:hypothetical protein